MFNRRNSTSAPPEPLEPVPSSVLTVPLILDAALQTTAEQIARCVYFTIEADEPAGGWFLEFGGRLRLPFLLIGLQGIVHRPISADHPEFTEAWLLDELIEIVESREELYVNTEYLFLPTALLKAAWAGHGRSSEDDETGPVPGAVFRVSHSLFVDAFRAARGGASVEELVALGRDVREEGDTPLVRYSPDETRGMRDWTAKQVERYSGFTGRE